MAWLLTRPLSAHHEFACWHLSQPRRRSERQIGRQRKSYAQSDEYSADEQVVIADGAAATSSQDLGKHYAGNSTQGVWQVSRSS